MSSRLTPVLAAAAAALFVAALGASATDVGPWYQALRKPSWQPPDLLFGPVWTVIYALSAYSGVLAWRSGGKQTMVAAFALNALLNVSWSWLFFKVHRPDWALVELVPFWLSIVLVMTVVWRLTPRGGALLLPYLAWVTFAGVLNLAVVRLNAPFGT